MSWKIDLQMVWSAAAFFLIAVAAYGVGIGICDAVIRYESGGCRYESIVSFVPTRVIVCEAIRKRW